MTHLDLGLLTKKGGDNMEIIKLGSDDLNQMAALSCCWPPGCENLEMPVDGL